MWTASGPGTDLELEPTITATLSRLVNEAKTKSFESYPNYQ